MRRWAGAILYGAAFVALLLYAYFPYLLIGPRLVDVASRPSEERRVRLRGLATLDPEENFSTMPLPFRGPGAGEPPAGPLDPPPWAIAGLDTYFDIERGGIGFFGDDGGNSPYFGGK